jgi:hypothetical protein
MTQQDTAYQPPAPKFWLGQFYMTSEAFRLNLEDVLIALRRHHNGDWGDVCAEDGQANESALQTGERLFSVYHDRNGVKFWIITEANRSATTVLLPADY